MAAVLIVGAQQAFAAEPSARISEGANAAAEAIEPERSPPSEFEDFAASTIRQLNEAAARLQSSTEELGRDLSQSMTESTAQMEKAWDETVGKFQSLQAELRESYEILERHTMRGIDAFQSWLAGDQTGRRPFPPRLAPQPPGPAAPIEESGPPIAV